MIILARLHCRIFGHGPTVHDRDDHGHALERCLVCWETWRAVVPLTRTGRGSSAWQLERRQPQWTDSHT